MIKSFLIFISIFSLGINARAQYYYKDIVNNKLVKDEFAILKEQNIRTVRINSFEDNGQPSDGFFGERKINKNYTNMETTTRSNVTGASVFLSSFNNAGQLIKTLDSSDISSSTSFYTYDEAGRVISILSIVRSNDDDFSSEMREEHVYEYNAEGQPLKMTRIKNGTDQTIILFSLDEQKNVSIEKNSKTGDTYYYYYDNKRRLTDVVHLNQFNQKMLPDYIFEYNNANQVKQMTTTEEGGSYYYIWKYTYNNGLRTQEKCFSKERRLMGTIEYEYK